MRGFTKKKWQNDKTIIMHYHPAKQLHCKILGFRIILLKILATASFTGHGHKPKQNQNKNNSEQFCACLESLASLGGTSIKPNYFQTHQQNTNAVILLLVWTSLGLLASLGLSFLRSAHVFQQNLILNKSRLKIIVSECDIRS